MHKLTDYIEMAATEYLHEIGNSKLDVLWIAEFFQDGGVQDDFPEQYLVDFYALVQKALTIKFEREVKIARLQQEKAKRSSL